MQNTTPYSDVNSAGFDSIVSRIFDLRGKFAIIGLTGRTGSGCSTAAGILGAEHFEDLALPDPKRNGEALTNNDRKYQICYDYLHKNWSDISTITIKATHVIIWSCLLFGFNEFIKKLELWFDKNIQKEQDVDKKADLRKWKAILKQHHQAFGASYNNFTEMANACFKALCDKTYKNKHDNSMTEISTFFEEELPKYCIGLKKDIQSEKLSYIEIFQVFGNFIREERGMDNAQSSIIELINLLVKFYRYKSDKIEKKRKTIIVIDALRNPYEILFLRERYSAFYVMSINTTEEERSKRLYKKSYSIDQVKECDKTEYPIKPSLRNIYLRQNIEHCNEISDIHLVNDPDANSKKPQGLTKQIAHYVSLILHPGLVPPFNEERTMQIAYTAKYNSGCLSRQVGAVITDEQFSIKSIGWNDVPEGQTPCILRNSYHVFRQRADEMAYSNYELNEEDFQLKLEEKIISKIGSSEESRLNGRHVPYCFKDIYNDKEKGENNQVHTRSLHAEENAFLQISKHGGQGIKGGKLFTTASPCELCAKKAYQLGIKEIYYIDLYPGISKKHILENGRFRPVMKMFSGAVGRAYIHLYQPILSYKDELKELIKPEQ